MNDDTITTNSFDLILNILTRKKYCNAFVSEISTIRQLYSQSIIRETFFRWLSDMQTDSLEKSIEITNRHREQGNCLFKNWMTNGINTILSYTYAIMTAPILSKELALAYGNRAAILFLMKYYEEAYNDCEIARKSGYPKDKLLKILIRQGSCAVYMKCKEKLSKILSDIQLWQKDEICREDDNVKLKQLISQFNDLHVDAERINEDRNKNMNQKSIIQKFDKKFGRFVIANETIKCNEEIIKETAFSFVPVYYKDIDVHTNCQNCAKAQIIPYPCLDCCTTVYCSPKCADDHFLNIHQYECIGYKKKIWQEIGIAQLAIRTLLCGIPELLPRLESVINDRTIDKIWSEIIPGYLIDGNFNDKFRYGEVLSLITNYDKMEYTDYIRYSMTAVMLTIYLKDFTSFFDRISKTVTVINKYDLEVFIGSLIMRHIGQLVSNGHVTCDLRIDFEPNNNFLIGKNIIKRGMLHNVKCERIFTGLFPRISFLNHSCDPNIRNVFSNNSLTIIATRDIAVNEEIFNCYGPSFRTMNTENRMEVLKNQYCFTCECKKCISIDHNELQTVICQNSECRSKILLKQSQENWWTHLKTTNIICSACKQVYNLDFYRKFIIAFNDLNVVQGVLAHHGLLLFDDLYKLYEDAKTYMTEFYEVRQIMCEYILLGFTVDSSIFDELYEKLQLIAIDNLTIQRFTYSEYSFEYLQAATYLLDLIAIKGAHLTDHLETIYKSISILSDDSKQLFINYINNYIER